MKKMFLLFFTFSLCSGTVFAQTRTDRLKGLFAEYNKRFSSGSYVPDRKLAREFTARQEAFADELKQSGGLQKILTITNTYDTLMVVDLYAFRAEDNSLIGFFYEKSKYDNEEEKSFLRFKILSDLEKGVGFVPVAGTYAVVVKGFYFKPQTGGTLQFIYLTDLKKNQRQSLNLFTLLKGNSWGLYREDKTFVQSADIQTWTSVFPPNGGVKKITLK